MEKHPNIMRLVDNKLGEQENTIEYYRIKQEEWEKERTELTTKISHLESDNEKFIDEIKRLDKKVKDYETTKNEKVTMYDTY